MQLGPVSWDRRLARHAAAGTVAALGANRHDVGPNRRDAGLRHPAGTERYRGPVLLTPEGSVLLLVDLQQRLMPAIHDADVVIANARRLVEGARLLGVPVRATEQNPAGLGPTVPELAGHATLAKTAFGAVAEPGFTDLLPRGAEEIVVAGCEAHVCVLQTVLGLLAARHRVLLVADAVGSRVDANKAAALDRAQRHGAEVVTTEMVLFEWLRDSTHPRFRDVQKLIR